MGLIERLGLAPAPVVARRPPPRAKAAGMATFTPALQDVLSMFDGTSASYGALYRKLQPVRTVVDFLASSIAATPNKNFRRTEGGRPEDRDHPASVLLRNPAPGLTPTRLWFGTVADIATYGRAYWRIIAERRGLSLVPLPPHRVTPKGGDLVQPSAYELWMPGSGSPINLSAEEVVDFHLYDPEDRRVGASKLQSLKPILEEEIEASRHRRGYWANSARVGGWLGFEQDLTDDQRTVLRESLQGAHAGAQNAGKVGIIPYKGGKFIPDGFSPKDAEFLEGRRFVLEATARVFGLPLSLLSMTETATYASQREFRLQLYTEVLPPWYELIQSEIEAQLFPWFTDTTDLYNEFVVEAKIRGDFLEQAEVLGKAIGRPWMTVREGRTRVNLPDRGETGDDDMAIPVGPNLALEGAPVPTSPAELAVVASLPVEKLRHALVEFFTRQERSVASALGAGGSFDRERWDRELERIIGKASAERENIQTEMALAVPSQSIREVFAHARDVRATRIASEQTEEAS